MPERKLMLVQRVTLQASVISERNASAALGGVQRPRSLDAEDDEGTEMKVIDNRRPVQFITRATFDIPQSSPVDSSIEFPTFREHTTKLEKSKINVNGTEGTSSLPFPPYNVNNVKCVMSGPSSVYSVMSWPSPNISMGKHVPFYARFLFFFLFVFWGCTPAICINMMFNWQVRHYIFVFALLLCRLISSILSCGRNLIWASRQARFITLVLKIITDVWIGLESSAIILRFHFTIMILWSETVS